LSGFENPTVVQKTDKNSTIEMKILRAFFNIIEQFNNPGSVCQLKK
jgi:hypothetical protein